MSPQICGQAARGKAQQGFSARAWTPGHSTVSEAACRSRAHRAAATRGPGLVGGAGGAPMGARGSGRVPGTHRHRRVHALHIALLNEDLTRLCAEGFDLRLLDVLAAFQLLDLPVQVGASARHRACAAGVARIELSWLRWRRWTAP